MEPNELMSETLNEPILSEEIPSEEISSEESLPVPTPEEEAAALRAELESLREALAAKEREQKRMMEEMGEFGRLFPSIALRDVPADVWQSVQNGIPLSAAYALYEKRSAMEVARADEINRRNAERSAGPAGIRTANEYFSPDEVRAMSPSEVRSNYKKIRESMKKWRV